MSQHEFTGILYLVFVNIPVFYFELIQQIFEEAYNGTKTKKTMQV